MESSLELSGTGPLLLTWVPTCPHPQGRGDPGEGGNPGEGSNPGPLGWGEVELS